MTVIELGEIGAAGPEPEHHSARSEFSPRSWRRWAASAVALSCVLLLGASGLPDPPTVRHVWEVRLGTEYQTTVRSDGVYVHQREGLETTVTRYELATGDVLWKRKFGQYPSYLAQGTEAGLLLLSGDEKYVEVDLEDGAKATVVYDGTTTAIDADTGDELWRQPGEVQNTAADTVLLADRTKKGDLSAIRVVGARDGGTVWQRRVPGAEQLTIQLDGAQPVRVVASDPTGRVTVLRYSDGAVLAEKRIPWTRSRPNDGVFTYLTVANGLLMVVRQEAYASKLAAYRVDTMEEVWSIDAAPYSYPQDCGPVLCVSETSVVHGVDPSSGRRVWDLPGRGNVMLVAPDRLLASTSGPDTPHHILADPATGAPIGSGGPGQPMPSPYGVDAVYMTNRIFGEGAAISSVDRLDLRTGRMTRIGAADGIEAGQCGTAGHYMGCDWGGRLVVTTFG
ncbi:PQQ-binding-like beta-propeller repeat protein [Actinoplanes sp. NPDC051861]|uniref:outer membrane protein assembly factor BamB family protein n=1 Tax=Actinoplanes sp. NPDC051861 TaxID=3155170 RepID=UPI00343AAA93